MLDAALMKATTLLRKQHKEVKAIFKKLEGKGGNKRALLKELADNLAAHMAIEQEIFYPAVKAIDEDMVLESFEEHALAEIAVKRLLKTPADDPSFEARVTATKELIEHHVEEEEEDLFPKVEKKMADELADLGERMEARFEEAKKAGSAKLYTGESGQTLSDRERGRALAF